MHDLSSALGAAGAGAVFNADGKLFTVMPFTKGMQASYSVWLKERAKAEAFETARQMRKLARDLRARATQLNEDLVGEATLDLPERQRLNAEMQDLLAEARALEFDAQSHLRAVDDRAAAGHYDYGSELAVSSLDGKAGSIEFLYLSLKPRHREATRELAEDLHEYHWDAVRKALKEANQPPEKKTTASPADPTSDAVTTTTTPPSTSPRASRKSAST